MAAEIVKSEVRKKEMSTSGGQLTELSTNLPAVQEKFDTLNGLLDSCCEKFSANPAIGMALEESVTYKELHKRVLILAAQLQKDGVGHSDRIAILAENSDCWGVAYLAIIRLGAVAVPILPDLPAADVRHILGEMKCSITFITQRQIEKLYDLESKLEKVITLDDYMEDSMFVSVVPFSDYYKEAEGIFSESYEQESLEFPLVQGGDLASILYTSGTSGFSKAVKLSHSNLCANGYSASRVLSIKPGSVFLSVLPVSHTYEFTVGFVMPLIKGCRIVYAGKTPTPAVLQKICHVEKPHAMLVVPLIMEKIYKKRVLPVIDKSKLLTFVCRFKMGRMLLYKKISSKLLDFFGGRLEVMGIGGAPINPTVEAFLKESGFPYIVGYGLTESAPLLSGGPQGDTSLDVGSSGKAIPDVKLRIHDPSSVTGVGEIQAMGPNVMQGYWNDPEATVDVFTEDGWLKTGDLGMIDDKGNLYIKGRAKSVIVLANGENIYPEAIEHKLNSYPFVVESLVIENNGVVEGWIYPDYEFVDSETQGQNRQQRHQYISSHLDAMRREVNEQLALASRLTRVLERREPFAKTATHKIKRYVYSADNMIN